MIAHKIYKTISVLYFILGSLQTGSSAIMHSKSRRKKNPLSPNMSSPLLISATVEVKERGVVTVRRGMGGKGNIPD